MPIFTLETDADGVATITWDLPGRSMNVLTFEGIAELDAAVDHALADPAVKGIVITSAKPDFAGGMDLNVLAAMKEEAGADPARGLFDGVMAIHRLLRKIERAGMDPKTLKGGKPVAWAAPGTLRRHRHRDRPRLPPPLPRRQPQGPRRPARDPDRHLPRRRRHHPPRPHARPHALRPPPARRQDARPRRREGRRPDRRGRPARRAPRASARPGCSPPSRADIVKPWDAKGYKMPGGAPYHPAGFMTFVGASAMVHGRTQGAYPAAKAMLSAIYEGALVPFDTALRIEARWFTRVLLNPSSGAMIRSLFLNKQALEKGAVPPARARPEREEARHPRRRHDGRRHRHRRRPGRDRGRADRPRPGRRRQAASAHVEAFLDEGVKRKRTTPEKKAEVLARITATPDYAALAGCDLVVEAVFEDPAVKAEATRRAEAHLAGRARSSPPTPRPCRSASSPRPAATRRSSSASTSSRRSRRWRWSRSSAARRPATAPSPRRSTSCGRSGRPRSSSTTPASSTPTAASSPTSTRGCAWSPKGVEPALIENAAKQLGMPLGPLQLVDETSIDLGVKIAKATRAAMGDAYPESPADDVLFALADLGRLGRKAKAGFYAYDEAGKRAGPLAGAARALAAAARAAGARRGAAPARDDPGARGGPGAGGGRADRHPRGRRRRHPRLGLHALVGRPVLLARHPRRGAGGGDLRRPRRALRAALRRRRGCCGSWRETARASTGGSSRRAASAGVSEPHAPARPGVGRGSRTGDDGARPLRAAGGGGALARGAGRAAARGGGLLRQDHAPAHRSRRAPARPLGAGAGSACSARTGRRNHLRHERRARRWRSATATWWRPSRRCGGACRSRAARAAAPSARADPRRRWRSPPWWPGGRPADPRRDGPARSRPSRRRRSATGC